GVGDRRSPALLLGEGNSAVGNACGVCLGAAVEHVPCTLGAASSSESVVGPDAVARSDDAVPYITKDLVAGIGPDPDTFCRALGDRDLPDRQKCAGAGTQPGAGCPYHRRYDG